MVLKKHHKIMIGGFSFFLIVLLISNSLFIYLLYGQLQLSYNKLESAIKDMNTKNQNQFNEITENLLENKRNIRTLSTEISSIDNEFVQLGEEFIELKSSVSSDFSEITEELIKSVVTISTDVGQGSGFFIANGGYLITNYHVLKGASAAGVYTYDGKVHAVSSVGQDINMDVALLKIEKDYPELKLADSDKIVQAEKVLAIGNPYGLSFSVSEGIVSATNRIGPNGLNVYIQTTAELNSGNSGGPLINKNKEVIGMNNFKLSESEGLGFALESNYIKETVNNISQEILEQTLI
jgi:S1-C subfamily serine protease